MSALKILFSSSIWVILAILASLAVMFWPVASLAVKGEEEKVLLIQISILLVTTAFTIFSTYDIEGKDEFVKDIIKDVFILMICVGGIVHGFTTGINDYWLPMAMMGVSTLFAFFDFIFSLNGGASKLLEMDKANIRNS
jgi:hypothetical protein